LITPNVVEVAASRPNGRCDDKDRVASAGVAHDSTI
jgi:hypothetical protein